MSSTKTPARRRLRYEVLVPKRPTIRTIAAVGFVAGAIGAAAGSVLLTFSADRPVPPTFSVTVPAAQPAAPPVVIAAPVPVEPIPVVAEMPTVDAAPLEMVPIITAAKKSYVVVSGAVESSWLIGKPSILHRSDSSIAVKWRIDPKAVPTHLLAAAEGRAHVAVAGTTRVYPAKLSGLFALQITETDVPEQFDLADANPQWFAGNLVSSIKFDGDHGDKAAFAFIGGGQQLPQALAFEAADSDSKSAAAKKRAARGLEKLRALPGAVNLQTQHKAADGQGSWITDSLVTTYTIDDKFALVAASVGACGEAAEGLAALWRLTDTGDFGELVMTHTGDYHGLLGASDIDGDGVPELLVNEGVSSVERLSSGAGAPSTTQLSQIVSEICPC